MVMDSVNDLVPIAAKEKGTKEKGNMSVGSFRALEESMRRRDNEGSNGMPQQ